MTESQTKMEAGDFHLNFWMMLKPAAEEVAGLTSSVQVLSAKVDSNSLEEVVGMGLF